MYFELKENRPHGTPENPFSQYHISDVKRAFQIPVHWHDELEIIYVKQGKLHVTISGENYIGSPKDAFVVSPGSLHFMGSPTGDADYYTFLFPLEYISFQTDDLMEKSILSPLKRGRLMISTQINDTAADICERLIEINAPISGKNAENTYAANIEAQFETKITLIKFIQTEDGCTGLLEHCLRDILIPAVSIPAFPACPANPDGVVGIRVFAAFAV